MTPGAQGSQEGAPFQRAPLHFSTQLAELRDSGKTDKLPFPIYTLLIIKSLSLCFPYMEYQSQRHREELFLCLFAAVCQLSVRGRGYFFVYVI